MAKFKLIIIREFGENALALTGISALQFQPVSLYERKHAFGAAKRASRYSDKKKREKGRGPLFSFSVIFRATRARTRLKKVRAASLCENIGIKVISRANYATTRPSRIFFTSTYTHTRTQASRHAYKSAVYYRSRYSSASGHGRR